MMASPIIATKAISSTRSSRLKMQPLTLTYVHRHINKAKVKVAGRSKRAIHKSLMYHHMVASIDPDRDNGTYCYHCRNIAQINETVVTHAGCGLTRVYHKVCAKKIKIWP